jgi:hypothetical protein
MDEGVSYPESVSMRRVFHTWWPLAASWLLMAVELPTLSAVVARLADPKIHLAAWGGVVFPLALIIEAPIIMLLAASTALSKDWASYQKLRRFMMWSGGILTAVHALVAFTPLYDFVVGGLIGAPQEIIEPARIGMRIMVAWSWAIAYRRFNQGVMIRFGFSRAVGIGTAIRLMADGLVLAVGLTLRTIPGIVVAASAVATGVLCEALYAGLRVRPVLRQQVRHAPPAAEALTRRTFVQFYFPLAMTSLLNLLVQPMGSAALSRMPEALESLAVWPVLSGLVFMMRSLGVAFNEVVFMMRSLGVAYNEVVVALLDEPRSARALRGFGGVLTVSSTLLLMLVTGTPLATLWFGRVIGLAAPQVALAQSALWFALLLPGLSAMMSWFQGVILHSRRTRGITEAVAIYLVVSGIVLAAGVVWGGAKGLFVAWTAFSLGSVLQTFWLWLRSRPAMKMISAREAEFESPLT